MKRMLIPLATLALVACVQERTTMPRPAYCVVGGVRPASESMETYGETRTPGLEEGPAPSPPRSHVVPERYAGADCVAPPWWQPPEP